MNEQTKQVGVEKTEWVRLTPENELTDLYKPMHYRHDSSALPHVIQFDEEWFNVNSIWFSDAELDALAAHAPAVKALATMLRKATWMLENIGDYAFEQDDAGNYYGGHDVNLDESAKKLNTILDNAHAALAPFEEADDES